MRDLAPGGAGASEARHEAEGHEVSLHPILRRWQAEALVRRRRSNERRRYPAPQRARRIDPNPNHIEAVTFALSRLADGGCTDEVGLGKTIEAGLVIAQLRPDGARRIPVRRESRLYEHHMAPEERTLYEDVTNCLLEARLAAFRGNQRRLLLIAFQRRVASSTAALAARLTKVAAPTSTSSRAYVKIFGDGPPDGSARARVVRRLGRQAWAPV